jgi:hypothetical protein
LRNARLPKIRFDFDATENHSKATQSIKEHMMKSINIRAVIPLMTVVLLGASMASEAADTILERRDVAAFDRVVVRAIGDLHIEQGDKEGLIVQAEPRAVTKITTVVKGGTLYIEMNGPVKTRERIRYHLTVKRLRGVVSDGCNDILAAGPLRAEDLEVVATGSGAVKIKHLVAETLRVRMTGASDVKVSGTVREQAVTIEGSGEYAAERLDSRRARVVVGGAGHARVSASDELAVEISGAGDVMYFGNPRVRQKTTGVGSVERGA